jgi:amino acid transporter
MMSDSNQRSHSSWAVGYATFASVLLLMAGIFQFVAGLVGVIEDDFYVVSTKWVFEFDVTTWGWIHMILGVVLFLSGLGILGGNVLARTVGVIVAGLAAVANFMWLPYYPVWSIVMIFLAVAVIWALTVHGRDITGA